MARNYSAAEKELRISLEKQPDNKAIKKKLIICYSQSGNAVEAFKLFYELISDDISFITNTDPAQDDCPCPELVILIENSISSEKASFQQYMMLGMLWLYCDAKRSLENFRKVRLKGGNDKRIDDVLEKIENYINKKNVTSFANKV